MEQYNPMFSITFSLNDNFFTKRLAIDQKFCKLLKCLLDWSQQWFTLQSKVVLEGCVS